jgi:methyl-accepting chemotaxis protein
MRITLKKKLIAICLAIGIIPAAVIGFLTWQATDDLSESTAAGYLNVARNVGEKIDRNLFERYGDVQAFGLNDVVQDKDSWYKKNDANPIVQAMNNYVDTYDIYSLTLLVDLDGKVIAVNSTDDNHKPVKTDFLYEQSFEEEQWFQDALAEKFYESKDGSFTGTVVEHLYIDPSVKKVYGDEGLSLGFTAPVRDADGKVIAIWKNVAKFSLVEEIVMTTYQDLKAQGLGSAEMTLLDAKGNVILDYDPIAKGSEKMARNMDVIGKLNLAEKNVEAAKRAVAGEAGAVAASYHARKQIYQAAGFAPLQGALGFPGMHWSVLVRVSAVEAYAGVNSIRSTIKIFGGVALALICLVAFFLANSIVKPINRTVNMFEEIADGDLTRRIQVKGNDEIAQLGHSSNKFVEKLQGMIKQIATNAVSVKDSSEGLSSTANQLASGAEETTSQATSVAGAAEEMATNMDNVAAATEQMSGNVKSVAAAVEEMTASIGEVARNAENAASVSDEAAQLADRSNTQIGELGTAADEIGKVIEVIQDIAEQTNLLALNATIEAARAGDAGKGFAVVATEVKELAKQTADATDDIRNRVEGIQNSSGEAVSAIGEITEVIRNINGLSRQIAAAVEEQNATTAEIAQSTAETSKTTETVASGVAQSAAASQEITKNISSVTSAAQQTSAGASQTQTAGKDMYDLSGELQELVGQFSV